MRLLAAIAGLFHWHEWADSAAVREGSIEQQCRCGAARHALFVGCGFWLPGPHPQAKALRHRIAMELLWKNAGR